MILSTQKNARLFGRWSRYRRYAYGEDGLVRINDWIWWGKKIRDKAGVKGS